MFKFKDYVNMFVEDFPFTAEDLANPINKGISLLCPNITVDGKMNDFLNNMYSLPKKAEFYPESGEDPFYLSYEYVNFGNITGSIESMTNSIDFLICNDLIYPPQININANPKVHLISQFPYVCGNSHSESRSVEITITYGGQNKPGYYKCYPPYHKINFDEIDGDSFILNNDNLDFNLNINFGSPSYIPDKSSLFYQPLNLKKVGLKLYRIKDIFSEEYFKQLNFENIPYNPETEPTLLNYDEFIEKYGERLCPYFRSYYQVGRGVYCVDSVLYGNTANVSYTYVVRKNPFILPYEDGKYYDSTLFDFDMLANDYEFNNGIQLTMNSNKQYPIPMTYYIKLNDSVFPFYNIHGNLQWYVTESSDGVLTSTDTIHEYYYFPKNDNTPVITLKDNSNSMYLDFDEETKYYAPFERKIISKTNIKYDYYPNSNPDLEGLWLPRPHSTFHSILKEYEPFFYKETMSDDERYIKVNCFNGLFLPTYDQSELENFLREFGIDFDYTTGIEPLPDPNPPVNNGEKVRRKITLSTYETTVEKVARKKQVYDTTISKVRRYPNGNHI